MTATLRRPFAVRDRDRFRTARLNPAARPALIATLLIAATAVLDVLYLVRDCPFDLAPDEAHYWDWSRRLDWSYYSKGPLVAWLIRASRELFGGLSHALVGSELVAVRLPAVACHVLLLTAVYHLAARTLRGRWLAVGVVGAALSLPAVAATGVLMTIDPPFLACWAWACVFVRSAVLGGGGGRAWAAAGAVTAVGVLAKYTMLLFPAVVVAYLAFAPGLRDRLRRPGFRAFCGISGLGLLPILAWNAGHDWVGLRHLAALAGGTGDPGGPRFDPLGLPGYVAGQFGILLGGWFVCFVGATVRHRPGRPADANTQFLWWFSVPVWLFFAGASVRSQGPPNWPAAAYVTGLVMAVGWLADQLRHPDRAWRRAMFGGFCSTAAIGVAGTAFAHYPITFRPLLAALVPAPSAESPAPVRCLDPTCRMAGWRTLAAEVDRLRAEVVRDEGREPILAGMVWTIPGELGFYCRGNPPVFSVGTALADRRSQYDVWRPNPVADAQAFGGRTFLYVGERMPHMLRVFDRVEPCVEVIASDNGVPVAAWKIWVCRGYRGFSADSRRTDEPGF